MFSTQVGRSGLFWKLSFSGPAHPSIVAAYVRVALCSFMEEVEKKKLAPVSFCHVNVCLVVSCPACCCRVRFGCKSFVFESPWKKKKKLPVKMDNKNKWEDYVFVWITVRHTNFVLGARACRQHDFGGAAGPPPVLYPLWLSTVSAD